MTGTNEKLRAIFLTGLMVLSVFAGTVALSGTAAAAHIANAEFDNGNAAAGSISDLNSSAVVDSGTTSKINVTSVAIDGSGAQNGDGVSFDGSFNNVQSDDISIVILNSDGSVDEEFVNDATRGSVTEQGERITVDKTGQNITVEGDQTLEVRIDDAFANPQTAGTYTGVQYIANPDKGNEYTASGSLTVAPGQTGAGGGGDISVPESFWKTNATRFQGQQLQVFNLPTDRTYNLETCDSFDSDLRSCNGDPGPAVDINDSGYASIDTSDLEGGYAIKSNESEYAIIGNNGQFDRFESEGSLTFSPDTDIIVQDFDASFSQSQVARGNQISLNLDSSRRANYKIEIASDQLTASQLDDLFPNASPEGDSSNVSAQIDSTSDSLTFAPPESFETDNYDFTVNVVDTTADDTASTEVVDESTAQADFTEGVYTEERGDNAEITLDIDDSTDNVYVTVGSEDVNYKTTLRVFDDNDDGDVSFNVNTFRAGRNKSQEILAYNGTDGDRVSFAKLETSTVPRPLESAEYDLTAAVGQDRSQTDAAVLSIRQPSLSGSALYTAPSRLDSSDSSRYTSASDVKDDATQASTIADGDHVIFQVNASGLYAYTDDTSDFNTVKGVDNQNQTIANLTLSQAGREINAENGSGLDITQGNLVTDEDNNTLYVAFDTDDYDLESGQQYELNFTVRTGEQSPYNGDSQSTTKTFRVRDRQASFDTDEQGIITVEPEADQTLSGTTNVAPGTEMTIRARSNTFFKTRTVTVQDDRSFSGDFNFSDVSENTSFTALIPNQNFADNAQTPGRVGQAETASATLNNQSFTGQASSVNVASVTTSDGGFVTIHDSTLVSDGAVFDSVRGTSAYLEPGTETNVTVELDSPIAPSGSGTFYAMPHLDTDGDQTYDFVTSEGADDGPYTTSEGNAVVDPAQISVERVATVTLNDQESDGESVLVESTRLPKGGFVTIHDATVADDPFGSVRGTSEYLDTGTSADIEITLDDPIEESGQFFAMPHRDTDGDEQYDFVSSNGDDDGPYLNADGQIVLDSAQITLPDMDTATATPTDEPDEPTPTPTDEETPTDTDEPETTTTSSDGQPGFGLVVSLIALVGAALIALRRRN